MTDTHAGLPAPLVPPECSMAGNDWFPLYFDRLRKSKWWRRATDLARARNIMLWGEAYKAQPAGSLLDDDDELAEAAGFGMDVDGFIAVKAEIMTPWVLCSDGRWYHPTVCEQVLDSWERHGAKRKAESARKAQYRQKVREKGPVPPKGPDVPRDAQGSPTGHADVSHGTPPNVPAGLGLQTIQTVQEGTNVPGASAARDAPAAGREPWLADSDFVALWSGATAQMRRRGRSQSIVWDQWAKAKKRRDPKAILRAQARYLAEDPDVGRTGGPGLQRWLKDRVYDQWLEAGPEGASYSPDRWRRLVELWRGGEPWTAELGPAPDQPGCLAPSAVLVECGLGDRTVVPFQLSQGSAA